MQPLTLLLTTLLLSASTLHAEESKCPLAAIFAFDEEPSSAPAPDEAVSVDEGDRQAPVHTQAAESAPESSPEVAPAPEQETKADGEPEAKAEPAPATAPVAPRRMPVPGDCATFLQGGEGYIFRAPTYYMTGKIVEIYRRPHYMGLCPDPGRTKANYRREDWLRYAEAYPCVTDPARMRDIEAIRVKVEVKEWDTPWTVQHGRNGMLMGGYFLDIELKEGVVIDIDGTLLQRCED